MFAETDGSVTNRMPQTSRPVFTVNSSCRNWNVYCVLFRVLFEARSKISIELPKNAPAFGAIARTTELPMFWSSPVM